MTPLCDVVTALDSTEYTVWLRQSTDHVDLSIVNSSSPSATYDPKYDKVLYHPADVDADALAGNVKTAIAAGNDLPAGIYMQG